MTRGTITLPRPEKDLLIEVRSGEWTLEKVLLHARKMSHEVQQAMNVSALPENVDRRGISRLIAEVHLSYWAC